MPSVMRRSLFCWRRDDASSRIDVVGVSPYVGFGSADMTRLRRLFRQSAILFVAAVIAVLYAQAIVTAFEG
jgi:hypothetical protein